jgi:RND family efflux transporter MFP subunit
MQRIKPLIRLTTFTGTLVALLVLNAGSFCAGDVDGFTEPYRTINVSAAEPGVITNLLVKEGDKVEQGQLLATLDSEVLEAAKEMGKAGMESMGRIRSASAAVELKKERLEKLQELHAAGHANPEEIMRARTEFKMAEAELLAAKEEQTIKKLEYSRIQTQIDRRKIITPIDGFVTKINKEVSEYVAATDPIVLTVVQCSRLKIVFPIPASIAANYSPGQQVKVNFADQTESSVGLVEVVSHVTDPESGTVRVKVVLDNPEGFYRSGMACSLKTETPSRRVLTAFTEKDNGK